MSKYNSLSLEEIYKYIDRFCDSIRLNKSICMPVRFPVFDGNVVFDSGVRVHLKELKDDIKDMIDEDFDYLECTDSDNVCITEEYLSDMMCLNNRMSGDELAAAIRGDKIHNETMYEQLDVMHMCDILNVKYELNLKKRFTIGAVLRNTIMIPGPYIVEMIMSGHVTVNGLIIIDPLKTFEGNATIHVRWRSDDFSNISYDSL